MEENKISLRIFKKKKKFYWKSKNQNYCHWNVRKKFIACFNRATYYCGEDLGDADLIRWMILLDAIFAARKKLRPHAIPVRSHGRATDK